LVLYNNMLQSLFDSQIKTIITCPLALCGIWLLIIFKKKPLGALSSLTRVSICISVSIESTFPVSSKASKYWWIAKLVWLAN
jgi:hypothetical protein